MRPSILSLLAAFALTAPCAFAASSATGTLTGVVNNIATGNFLAGAKIEVPALHFTTLTDDTGNFLLPNLPAGPHEIVATYLGLDAARTTVVIGAGQRAVRNFELTTGIYQLQAFTVTGEREGDAAAITAQRNAPNLKNVTATDSFGNLPNFTAGELAVRLPGVVSDADAGGGLTVGSIRGGGLNTVTMDGGQITSQGALGRGSSLNTLSATMFESVELIKGHTPEGGADSLGATMNFKTRTPLTMKEKRRVTYAISGRFVPAFTEQIPLRHQHRAHELVNVAYQERFDVLGGARNLGVSLNLFHSEEARGWFNTVRDEQNTANNPRYLWDYRTQNTYNHRRQHSGNLKFDFRSSPTTKFNLAVMGVDHSEVFRRQYDVRAFTNQTVGTTGTAGILPGYTDRVTQVRASTGSNIDVTSTGPRNFFNRQRRFSFGGEHEFKRWSLDYSAVYNLTHINIGEGEGAILTNRIANVGWILDRTQSDLYPRFTQTDVTSANDITNPANYRPNGNMSNGDNNNDHEITELRGNARYTFATAFPLSLKTGFHRRDQFVDEGSISRRWAYIGTTALPANTNTVMSDTLRTGRNLPVWEASDFIRNRRPITPSLWREDAYFFESNKFIAERSVNEIVTSGYAQLQGKFGDSGLLGRTGFLTGVRTEKTATEATGYVRSRTPSNAALQLADPVRAAQIDYAGTQRTRTGGYTKSFPSAHLTHDITANVKARAAWSTSYGKPSMANLLPNETVSRDADGNDILTINNPSLLPQTSENWDFDLDWYFEPVGNLSLGWFRKSIQDYLITGQDGGTVPTGPDNGYGGDYGGYLIRTSSNGGSAYVQGWEFNYRQQFNFLPGIFRGLSGLVNYTYLTSHGNRGGTTVRYTGEIPGFTPHSGNASVTWRWRKFSTRYLVNYSGNRITAFNANAPWRNTYRVARTVMNLGFAYQLRPNVSLTCDIDNLTNEPQVVYRGSRDQLQSVSYHGLAVTLGVSGRF